MKRIREIRKIRTQKKATEKIRLIRYICGTTEKIRLIRSIRGATENTCKLHDYAKKVPQNLQMWDYFCIFATEFETSM